MNRREFDGKHVLVTGGTKGIGAAVATRLREGGATVLTTARTKPSDLADANLFVASDITTADGCATWPRRFATASEELTSSFMSSVARQRPLAALRCWTIKNGNAHST